MIERNANGEWETIIPDEYTQAKETTKAWLDECEGGREFKAHYNFAENFFKIAEQIEFHHYDTSFTALEHVFTTLRDSGQLVTSAPAAPAAADDVPRAANGTPLTGSQLEWRNFAIWANDPKTSSRDIAERRRTSPSFNKFYQESLKREMNVPIDGDVRPFNSHLTPSPVPSNAEVQGIAAKASLLVPALKQFAAEFVTTPASRVRFLRSSANPSRLEYERSFQACIEAGLI